MKTVKRDRCGTIAMVEGGEETHPMVIDEGNLKEWVGIGWIHIRHATEDDYKEYPVIKD